MKKLCSKMRSNIRSFNAIILNVVYIYEETDLKIGTPISRQKKLTIVSIYQIIL